MFPGEDGRSYAFYSIARDLTGNLEDKAPAVEATTTVALVRDGDGDGLPDDEDHCPASDTSPTVVVDGCDSGVPNAAYNQGCTINDRIGEIAGSAQNYGQFVSGVSNLLNGLKRDGTITGQQQGAIQRCAAQASIP